MATQSDPVTSPSLHRYTHFVNIFFSFRFDVVKKKDKKKIFFPLAEIYIKTQFQIYRLFVG